MVAVFSSIVDRLNSLPDEDAFCVALGLVVILSVGIVVLWRLIADWLT